jgi:hypothetical protein
MFSNVLEMKVSEADRDLRNRELRDREDVGGVDDLFEDRCEPEERPCTHLVDGLGLNSVHVRQSKPDHGLGLSLFEYESL